MIERAPGVTVIAPAVPATVSPAVAVAVDRLAGGPDVLVASTGLSAAPRKERDAPCSRPCPRSCNRLKPTVSTRRSLHACSAARPGPARLSRRFIGGTWRSQSRPSRASYRKASTAPNTGGSSFTGFRAPRASVPPPAAGYSGVYEFRVTRTRSAWLTWKSSNDIVPM